MKRKILIGLGAITALTFAGSLYLIFAIESATTKLNNMIMLHQVEILREEYLIQVKRVQADLLLQDTPFSRNFETFLRDIRRMDATVGACRQCHHGEAVDSQIRSLQEHTKEYQNALSRVITIRANAARLAEEKNAAVRIGEGMIDRIHEMLEITGANLGRRTEFALAEISESKNILYLLVALVPLLCGGLAYSVVRGLTRPVETLVESTRRLREGDLDHRVPRLRDEFEELASSFNRMAESLQHQMEQMQRTEQMVVVARVAAGLAHEIKNPLAGIKAAMYVLSEETPLPEEDREVLRKVIGEIVHLETLMKNFLSFAKPPKPFLSSLDVNEVLRTAFTFCRRPGESDPEGGNGIRIVTDLSPLPPIRADLMQLTQVFLNLLLNALEAMPGGGTLSVHTCLSKDPEGIGIEISDTGPGIPEADAERIFQPFFTTKPKGTGLGLAICLQLIEQHGGWIRAGNRPGGGATFRIHLPFRAASDGEPS